MKKKSDSTSSSSTMEKDIDNSKNEFKLAKYGVKEKGVTLTLMLSLIVDMLGFSLTIPILPTIAANFGAGELMIGIIISANAFTSLIAAPIWGRLSDKYGRKPILMINQAGTLAAFIVLGFSNNVWMILAARCLDGAFGGQFPVIQSMVSDTTEPDTRTDKMSKVMLSVGIASMIGPSLGGLLGAINWRIPPFVTAGLSILSIILTTYVLPETMPKERREDLAREKAAQKERLSKSILNPEVITRLIQYFLAITIFTMFISISSLVLGTEAIGGRYGLEIWQIGIVISGFVVMMSVLGAGLIKPALKAFGTKKLLLIAGACGLLAWILFPILDTLLTFTVFLLLLVIFQAFIRPIIITNITKAVPDDRQGEVSGWTAMAQSLSQSIIPLLATAYLEIGLFQVFEISINAYWMLGITGAIVGAFLSIFILVDAQKHPKTFENG